MSGLSGKNRQAGRTGFRRRLWLAAILIASFVLLVFPGDSAHAAPPPTTQLAIPGIGNVIVPTAGGVVLVPGLGNITVPPIPAAPSTVTIPEIGDFNLTSFLSPAAITSLNPAVTASLPPAVLNATPAAIVSAVLPSLASGNLNTVLTTLTSGNLNSSLTALSPGNLNSVLSQVTTGNLNTLLPTLSAGSLNSILPALTSGNLNSILPALTSGNLSSILPVLTSGSLNTVLPALNAGNLNTILPALSGGSLNTILPALTSGNLNSILPALTSGNLNSILPVLTSGSLNTVLPALNAGNLNTILPALTSGNLNTILPALTSGSLNSILPVLTSGNLNTILPALTSGSLNTVLPALNAGNLNTILPQLTTGNLNSVLPALSGGSLNTILPQLTGTNLNNIIPALTPGNVNTILPQLTATSLGSVLPQLTSGNLLGALQQLSTGNLTSTLNTLATNPTGLANTLSTLGSTATNTLLTSMSTANLQSLLGGLSLPAATSLLGALTPAALAAVTASLPPGFLAGLLGGSIPPKTPLPSGADLADGAVVTCSGCCCEDADQTTTRNHIVDQYAQTDDFINAQFKANMDWILEDFFKQYFVVALKLMTEQLVTNGMNQMLAVGAILDAKTQLEAQLVFQQRLADAHKDYQPSVDMCVWATVTERLPGAEARTRLTAHMMAQHSLYRLLGNGDTMGADDTNSDALSRIEQVRKLYCNPNDNMGDVTYMCNTGGPADRRNHDIDYGRFMGDMPSLDINFNDTTLTNDEQDVLMLSNYLYGHHTFPRIPEPAMKTLEGQETWMDVRSVIAQNAVAENSFDNIVALKSAAPDDTGSPPAADYMAVILQRMGVSQPEAQEMLAMDKSGTKTARPSYYEQLQLLSQAIFQSPSFYVNLYDTPANVTRKSVGMQAINLMLDRETYLSELREEGVLSQLLEMQVVKAQENLSNVADNLKRTEKPNP